MAIFQGRGEHGCPAGWAPALLLLLALLARPAQGQSWTIARNAFRTYFNVDGDAVSEGLSTGAKVEIGGKTFEVQISQFFDSVPETYVQLDKTHGASVGDKVSMVSATSSSSSSGSRTSSRTITGSAASKSQDDDDDYEEDTRTTTPPPKPQSRSVSKPAAQDDFDGSMPFVDAVSVEEVTAEVRKHQKPGLVFVTQPWCGACKRLKGSLLDSGSVKQMMDKFVVAHAVGDAGAQWQSGGKQDGYIPRLYFLDRSGEHLDITGPNSKFTHFFSDAQAVEEAMREALKKVGRHDEL